MGTALLFIDGSVNNKTKMGMGGYLMMPSLSEDFANINIRSFANTSSTKLELQTLLWALEEIDEKDTIRIYTDSQNLVNLMARKQQLVKREFQSLKGKPLMLGEQYREFYKKMETRNFEFKKVKGHSPSKERDRITTVFSKVDRAVRKASREERKCRVLKS